MFVVYLARTVARAPTLMPSFEDRVVGVPLPIGYIYWHPAGAIRADSSLARVATPYSHPTICPLHPN